MNSNNDVYHIPVLLNEVIEGLNIQKDEWYIDCNLGGGGHTAEILKKGGKVLGFDVDTQALSFCEERFKKEIEEKRLIIEKTNFKNIDTSFRKIIGEKISPNGILYDLGVSTFQIKKSKKGFSFEDSTALDMRMDDELGVKAIDLIAALSESELAQLIFKYGEDPQSKHFAKIMKEAFKAKGTELTADYLAELIKRSSKYSYSRNHPATRVFQALRIAVNSELKNLEESLDRAVRILKTGGRIMIITFHSLEDKIAKDLAKLPGLKVINSEPILPNEDEVNANPSSRSSKLRIYEKI